MSDVLASGFTAADVATFEYLGITAEILARQQIRRVTDPDARELLALRSRPGKLDGLLFPYLDPEHHHVLGYRLRRDHPDFEGGKPRNKYLSSYGDRRHLYFACETGLVLKDVGVPLILPEAEKSVLAITCAARRLHRPVLSSGLGGCWGWKGRIGMVDTPTGGRADEYGPLPDFDHFLWRDRDVVLAFDSNAATNGKVQSARRALALELTRRGAAVRLLELPAADGVNGPDDYIARYGDAAFFALVDQAPAAATADVIFRLNHQHAVVQEAGKTVVITEKHDPIFDRRVVVRSSFADFRNFYLRESVPVGVDDHGQAVMKPIGHVWLTHRDRRQYDGVIMSPNHDIPGYLNLWRGYAVEPKAGDYSLFNAHLYDVICGGNATLYDYVFNWMATGVQVPERQAETALVFRGGRGAGKGLVARTYGELFGQHYLQIANTKHLVGNFNAHLQDTVVLFADEAFWAGDKAGESVLKMLVTEPVIPIERKGVDVVLVKNLLHIILASNQEWVVPAGLDERRFCVLDVDPGHMNDYPYFAAIVNELDNGGRAALLHDLLVCPLDDFNIRAVPQTEALREQKVLSLGPNDRWLFDKLMAGRWLQGQGEWQSAVSKDALHDDYVVSLQKLGVERRRTETELGMFLTKSLSDRDHLVDSVRRRVQGGERSWFWVFPSLADCRAAFDRATHSHHPWPWPKTTDE